MKVSRPPNAAADPRVLPAKHPHKDHSLSINQSCNTQGISRPMTDNENKFVKNGLFSVSADRELNGTLSLDGRKSALHLWAHDLFDVNLSKGNTITGILEDRRKVSLIGCVNAGGGGRSFGRTGVSQHYKLFPHYVIVGNRHISYSDKVISRISIVVDDAPILFHDRFSFGTNVVKPTELDTLSSLETLDKSAFNEHAVIAYYTGKEQILCADTVIGIVSAHNAVSFDFGGPKGAHIHNKVSVRLSFPDPVDVAEMHQRIRKILRFFEVIAGRPQNILEVKIVDVDQDPPTSSAVYHCT